MNWYLLAGRLDGHDDDTTCVLQAKDYDDAVAKFERRMRGGEVECFVNLVVRCGTAKPVIEHCEGI